MAFDTSRLRFGDLIAGGSAVALFIFMLFPWYNLTTARPVSAKGLGSTGSDSFNAWQALGPGDLFLLLLILIVIGCVVARAAAAEVNLPVPLSTVILGAGALASLYILFRIISLPGDPSDAADVLKALGRIGLVDVNVGRSFGIFLGFLAAVGMAVGGFLSARERGEAIPGVDGGRGGLGGAPSGGPLGGGQPAAGGQPYGGQPAATAPGAGVGAPAAGVANPAAAAAGAPKADWYPDPQGVARLRYWDGTQWTDQTAD